MQGLEGKVAVVTGGASGIGKAMAEAFRDAGMQVVIADVEPGALDATAAELGVHAFRVDVTMADEVAGLAAAVADRFGTCHVLCNNAGVGGGGLAHELTLADWKWVIDVNLWGVVHGLHSFLPMMLANPDGGHIVNTASMAGLFPLPGAAPYSATKYAVVGISEVLREELQGTAVGVSVLCPGFVRTNIFTSQRNRPAELRNPAPNAAARANNDDIVRIMNETAMDPRKVGDAVLAAVRDDRFWIITHPELLEQARSRRDDLFAGNIEADPQ
jgi:NADP-dependent 3-hydroxy acid dehydrogenase YdfG